MQKSTSITSKLADRNQLGPLMPWGHFQAGCLEILTPGCNAAAFHTHSHANEWGPTKQHLCMWNPPFEGKKCALGGWEPAVLMQIRMSALKPFAD